MNHPIRLKDALKSRLLEITRARAITDVEALQELWSGYGQIIRVRLDGGNVDTVIVKEVHPPRAFKQPRGWNTDASHLRKLESYRVEAAWYRDWAAELKSPCRVAMPLWIDSAGDDHTFVLEDLDAVGFSSRRERLTLDDVKVGLRWLAHLHATFMGAVATDLWSTGTYWHLGTRQEEWDAMPEADPLKSLAAAIDSKLSTAKHQTIVHGDAKVANFCWPDTSGHVAADSVAADSVAAVDFQYVGRGCGVKDVAYFMGSCLSDQECQQHSDSLLDSYFDSLRLASQRVGVQRLGVRRLGVQRLESEQRETNSNDRPHAPAKTAARKLADQIESEWRELYPYAWADFQRFLVGWCPGHFKLGEFSHAMTQQAIKSISDEGPTGNRR